MSRYFGRSNGFGQEGPGYPGGTMPQMPQLPPSPVSIDQLQQQIEALNRQLRGLQGVLDGSIQELYRQVEALSRPGAHAMRPIGDWGWYVFTLTHAGSDTQSDFTRVADQYEFWLTYIVGTTSGADETVYDIRISDSRNGNTYLEFEGQLTPMELFVGSIEQPHICQPPRIMGSQITVESSKSDAGTGTLTMALMGIRVNVDRARGQTYGE